MKSLKSPSKVIFYFFVFICLSAGLQAATAANAETTAGETSRYILHKSYLFDDMSGYVKTTVDENSNTISTPEGIIGEVEKGQVVTKIHRIRFSRMQVSLADGRKGWVDIPMVSPSGTKDAYLIRKLKLSEIMASPGSVEPSVSITGDNKNLKFKRNTPLMVLEWKHVNERNKTKTIQSGEWWAKVEIEGYKGWIEKSRFRFEGQMFDSVIPLLWYPIHWFNNLLGDGFWAGFFIFLLLVVPMFIGYSLARCISSWLKFLPNFVLYIIIIVTGLVIYSKTFMTIWDASVFNVAGILTMSLLGLLIFIAATASFAVLRKRIYETRCPDCKHWKGKVYQSDKIRETNIETTTTWKYSDGTQKREVSHTQIQTWEDFCNCSNCGYCWKIKRIETNEY